MSVPEYVFQHRIQEFYDELKSGRNLWKIDETLGFVDEKGRNLIKKWIQDPRFPWTFGRGYTVLQQAAPVISLVVDADSDRSYMLGNYAGDGTDYEPDGTTPQSSWTQNARLKTGSFLIVMTAPNADMLTAMYALIERALYEGETANLGEENIIQFFDYGISELRYSGTDIRPDQSYIPTNTWARTLRIGCTYLHTWTGRSFGSGGYAFSIDLGNVYATDDTEIQRNPQFVDGYPAIQSSAEQTYMNAPGVNLYGKTIDATTAILTTDGMGMSTDNSLVLTNNSALMFSATIGANIIGISSAIWKFAGIIRRYDTPESTHLIGITTYDVVADPIFEETYIDIDVDLELGALKISAKGVNTQIIDWNANIQTKELS